MFSSRLAQPQCRSRPVKKTSRWKALAGVLCRLCQPPVAAQADRLNIPGMIYEARGGWDSATIPAIKTADGGSYPSDNHDSFADIAGFPVVAGRRSKRMSAFLEVSLKNAGFF
jgi:hypothetical protein